MLTVLETVVLPLYEAPVGDLRWELSVRWRGVQARDLCFFERGEA